MSSKPTSLKALLPSVTRRQLRSSDKLMVVVLKIRTIRHCARSFLYSSTTLENAPCDGCLTETNSVAGGMKTHLFNGYFSPASLFQVLSSYISLHCVACIYAFIYFTVCCVFILNCIYICLQIIYFIRMCNTALSVI